VTDLAALMLSTIEGPLARLTARQIAYGLASGVYTAMESENVLLRTVTR
jgi:hypothetical protein